MQSFPTTLAVSASLLLVACAAFVAKPISVFADGGSGLEHPVVQAGLPHLGGHGGQCYIFARDTVAKATGMQIGKGYRHGYLGAGGIEVDPADARAGDILQISNPSDHATYYHGMHTAVVIENLGNGTFRVLDSNSNWDEVVRIRDWTPQPAPHLRLYAYRFWVEPSADDMETSSAPDHRSALFGEGENGACLKILFGQFDGGNSALLEWPTTLLARALGLDQGALCDRIKAELRESLLLEEATASR